MAGWKLFIVVIVSAVLGYLVWKQVDGINGPDYWRWPWRASRGIGPYFYLFLAALPLAVAEIRFAPPHSAVAGIMLMMMTVGAIEIGVRDMDTQSLDLTRLAAIIEEPGSTGYFTHAEELVRSGQGIKEFLRDYPRRMAGYTLHARNKPPGSILFYVPFLRLAPTEDGAAMAAGLCIALLAMLSVPATYWMIAELTNNRAAAYQAAAVLSLCPGLVLFLPEFDQFYPIYSCLLIILWARALRTGSAKFAIGFGALFSLVCFQTFNLLMLGIFVGGYSLIYVWQRDAQSRKRMTVQCVVVFATMALIYGVVWIWSGFNPISTLMAGIANHAKDMPATHRTWPRTVPYDLTDFALGAGWVGAILAMFGLWTVLRKHSPLVPLVLLCFVQPLAVALLGLLQTETARVWVFMLPMLLIPAGLELAEWPPRARMGALACLWVMTALLSQNMVFV